ncbi:MAG TPA: hypothetical protein VJT71_05580 [Pyrinomonadaceae bacterium]|nr:hypothetical protein [Pyrinomonadaceae bacterium]
MNRSERLSRLRVVQAEVDAIRRSLGIRGPDELIYVSAFDSYAEVIVVADGFGAATTSVVEGNYPIDFFTRYEKEFADEASALRAAERIINDNAPPEEVLI